MGPQSGSAAGPDAHVCDCPVFTPESSGLGRSDGRKAAEGFVARFNETGSLRPVDYANVTRNASYYVALLLERHTA